MAGRRGRNSRKIAALPSSRSNSRSQAPVQLAIEASNTWDNRLRKRGCKDVPESHVNSSKTPPKRSRKTNQNVVVRSTKPSGILSLPNEVLAHLFNYFPFDDLMNVEKVCRKFRMLAKQITWPKVTVIDDTTLSPSKETYRCGHPKPRKVTDNIVKMILTRARIKELDLSSFSLSVTYQIASSLNLASDLTLLDLSGVRLTNTSLRTIGRYCSHLESVSFESCFCDGSVEKGMDVLFSKCKKIKYLNLAENNKLEGECFSVIPETVAYLNLAGCYNILIRNVDILTERLSNSLLILVLENYENANLTNMNKWLSSLKKLKRLEVSSWFVSFEEGQHLDFSNLLDLEILKLTYNFWVNNGALNSLRFCRKLKSIDLSYNLGMQADIFSILKNIKSLEACSFDGWEIIDDNIISFINEMGLKAISIGDCKSLNYDTIIRIVKECKSLRRVSLRKLTTEQEALLSPESFSTTEIKQRMEFNRCEINVNLKGVYLCICPVSDKDYFEVRQTSKEFKTEL